MKNSFFRKRVFLASISTGHTSYLLAEVESSRGGEYKWGHCMLTIADCRRRIQLEFFLGTVRARRESLRKLDLMLKVLGSFRNALLAEAQAITEYERATKIKPQKSTKDT
ncbi:MAG TPA: hypothetical protein VFI24_23960 [Pyrinomonadaceae bacterium]|nr:hypothetical protein [Pyrinomonadaceae bacterium]